MKLQELLSIVKQELKEEKIEEAKEAIKERLREIEELEATLVEMKDSLNKLLEQEINE